ncbi:extracellular solute-binding protein [Streptomyces sp. NBC_01754]|uniref:ABC transporter substrate-binding protein n=1 Tax=Streptomyces sp. NBC_01754 TaxID=2975930 RepID=UPI002DD7D073|nr:extracellular solute-binding protein [Streptomyces sp. NBC_01754]WSC96395.1 extracellular solute-binding protein [Streptomyces sp. NBC_01754]
MGRLRSRVLGAVGAATVAVLLSSCGTPSSLAPIDNTAAYSKYNSMTGTGRHDSLVEEAKKEGRLVVYTTSANVAAKVAPAFEKKYGISVSVYRATTETLRQRILQEADAGRPLNDVVETNDIEMAILNERGLLGEYVNDIPVDERARLPFMVGAYFIATLPVHNTGLVKPADAPRELSDFTDAKWKGKLALEKGDENWYLSVYRYYREQGMSKADFVTMMKKIAANSRQVSGHLTSHDLLKSGEYSVFVTDFLHYVTAREPGAVDYAPVVGPVNLQVLGAVPMRGAEHPAAALLWSDFYLTDAQPLLNNVSGIPTNPSAVPGYRPLLPDDDQVMVEDWRTLLTDGATWSTAYGNLLAGKDPVLPNGAS